MNERDYESGDIDEELCSWQQGDCVVGEQLFAFRFLSNSPITEAAREVADPDVDVAETPVRGMMVATQTCDVVRTCGERPFVEVCPLVEVDSESLRTIERGYRPRYAFIPGVSQQQLVADLDRVMTVEKAVVAMWERTQGCRNDSEIRGLAQALARKRSRHAFPDDFGAFASELQRRLQKKHDKKSLEGRALRALREIRVAATPSWNADPAELFFWFIRNDEDLGFEGQSWDHHLARWLDLVPETGRFKPVHGQVASLADLSAKDYVESDPLDLDHLSTR